MNTTRSATRRAKPISCVTQIIFAAALTMNAATFAAAVGAIVAGHH